MSLPKQLALLESADLRASNLAFANLQAEANRHLSFIAEQISDATLRESFLRRNRVTGSQDCV